MKHTTLLNELIQIEESLIKLETMYDDAIRKDPNASEHITWDYKNRVAAIEKKFETLIGEYYEARSHVRHSNQQL